MINAVILLNDDLDNVSECATYTSCKSAHAHRSGGASNLFFLLSVSIPRPLFPSKQITNESEYSRWLSDHLPPPEVTFRDRVGEACLPGRQTWPEKVFSLHRRMSHGVFIQDNPVHQWWNPKEWGRCPIQIQAATLRGRPLLLNGDAVQDVLKLSFERDHRVS